MCRDPAHFELANTELRQVAVMCFFCLNETITHQRSTFSSWGGSTHQAHPIICKWWHRQRETLSWHRGTAGLPISCTLGRYWDVVITRSDFKSETIFLIPQPKLHGARYVLDFLVKPKNALVWPFIKIAAKKCFPGFFVRALSLNWAQSTWLRRANK